MLNNGGVSGGSSSCSSSGMGTPDGTNGGMHYNPGSPSDYPPAPSSNPSSMSNSFHPQQHYNQHPGYPHNMHHQQQQQQHPGSHPHHPHHNRGPPPPLHERGGMPNGMMGHGNAGGICSQTGLNQEGCPQDSKIRQCAGCGEAIMDRILYKVWDGFWHHQCLRCTMCGTNFVEQNHRSCYCRDGRILCKEDYLRMYGMKGICHGCNQQIYGNELVLRAGGMGSCPPMVFHLPCFNCSKCGNRLNPGDRYSTFNGAVICEADVQKLMKQNGIGSPLNTPVATSNGPTPTPRKGKVGRPRRSRD